MSRHQYNDQHVTPIFKARAPRTPATSEAPCYAMCCPQYAPATEHLPSQPRLPYAGQHPNYQFAPHMTSKPSCYTAWSGRHASTVKHSPLTTRTTTVGDIRSLIIATTTICLPPPTSAPHQVILLNSQCSPLHIGFTRYVDVPPVICERTPLTRSWCTHGYGQPP